MVGFDSLILIGIVALLLFGPDKLPQYLRELGKIYAEIKKAQREFERELNQQQNALVSKPVRRPPSDKVLDIARKMGIQTENKTEDQLLSEIAAAVNSRETAEAVQTHEAAEAVHSLETAATATPQHALPAENSVCPQGDKKDI
ncbi:Sec-independent protein translocase subunit TatA/TatB [Methanocella arvoryzae]|uniref:Sec-independent protein translocase (TatA-like) n=1 Tax=Methanocella arvoryzae (strain DSM 22066 / NBRC 105507 / MRE50) TaxID=351160 RepID=Q0W8E8_METAR|nr:twin-arginine translocase TatA/TatE family subunit [Methanocella arvoryzae]CAJ35345.1 putative sec-independent protein translocase (TatA-like) [Methanocella arvoryzae MRE50]